MKPNALQRSDERLTTKSMQCDLSPTPLLSARIKTLEQMRDNSTDPNIRAYFQAEIELAEVDRDLTEALSQWGYGS